MIFDNHTIFISFKFISFNYLFNFKKYSQRYLKLAIL